MQNTMQAVQQQMVRPLAFALGVAYLLAPPLQSALLTEFHAAPLAVPADLNSLPTPQPGASRPQEGETKAAVLDAMFGTPKQ